MSEQRFPSTHWSLILDDQRRSECLEELADKYWTAIYLYARKFGHDEEKAKDFTQELFLELQKGNLLEKADPQRGRFRAYLIGILKNLCRRDLRKQAQHRKYLDKFTGLFKTPLAKDRENILLAPELSPEEVFNREWAQLIVNQALDQLREYCRKEGKDDRALALKAFELQYFDDKKPGEIADLLDRDVKWISEKLYRLKQKYREYLRKIVQDTLQTEENLDEEIREIMGYL